MPKKKSKNHDAVVLYAKLPRAVWEEWRALAQAEGELTARQAVVRALECWRRNVAARKQGTDV